ncbi:UDP-4-amino-4,6-dideoxy-N-acetyl-beta-L-altrosamine transaminase [Devosia ginsengisoli]|uniref:UDP-4-amino-4, 6-dideoxy-N-acetyl-beta-L-altrosamine transaminase n=1 Tax=Devosia ginsengisoli TaxID=400770 RepID=UPI0026EA2BEE|nr:UDP-4-amino-4,6-dideoxy-N-acetyl-beta-L-altrosamine transaminase [Devosia ginsengisoli]MCR6672042.1 UDP-4-amino-4,6-dideoxy-N-acetyl-beta-L-altrosamine transaminase [Devosia ginsengisoli]
MIPYGRQWIDDADVAAVVSVLKSDFLTQGPQVPRFEASVAAYCGIEHAVAVNSATSALHIACLALGVGPGDTVWTSPNTFVASANCARYCGAAVDFVDIDPATLNLCPDALAEKLEIAARNGTLPKVVIPVHFAGTPCEMERIHALSEQYGFAIVEDASHAIGARYRDTIVGDCRYSDITVFSFHPVKIITTAEGGLATTRSAELARKMRLFRSHGVTRDIDDLEAKDEGAWYYEQTCLGYNYRMSELHAALGVSQMAHLDAWVARRHKVRARYDAAFVDGPIEHLAPDVGTTSALHLYTVQVDRRRAVFERMRSRGIGVNVHYIPVHTQPDFRKLGFRTGQFPRSERYYDRAISLPIFGAISDDQVDIVIREIQAAVRAS